MAALTAKQRQMIFGLKTKMGLSKEDLYAAVYRVTGKEHISELSKAEGIQVIDSLSGQQRAKEDGDKISWKQRGLINHLVEELGWNKYRLAKFISKRFKWDAPPSDPLRWMTKKQGVLIIEAMKKMIERGYGDKKGSEADAK